MSQPRSPTDTQALLQSMLQRLKLQPSSDTQGRPRPPHLASATHDPGQGGGRPPCIQTANANRNGAVGLWLVDGAKGSPKATEWRGNTRGREMRKWDSREEFGIPVWDCDFGPTGPKDTAAQQQAHEDMAVCHRGRVIPPPCVSPDVPSPTENADSREGEVGGSGQVPSPAVTPTGTLSGEGSPRGTNVDLTPTDIGGDVITCRKMGEKVPYLKRKLKFSLKGGRSDKQPSPTGAGGGSGGEGRRREGEREREAGGEERGEFAVANQNRGQEAESTDAGVPNHRDDVIPGIGDPSPLGLSPLTPTPTNQVSSTMVAEATRNSRTSGQDQTQPGLSPVQPESVFTPRVYAWSLKSTNPGLDTGSPAETGGERNREPGPSVQNDVMRVFSSNQGAAESPSLATRKKKRESSKKRWTEKIKERWREKQGSSAKRGKEDDGVSEEKTTETDVNLSGGNKPSVAEGDITKMSNRDKTPRAPIKDVQGEAPPTQSEEGITDSHRRSSFDFSLGSFSLLDEILTGQEWASFVNPAQTESSANRRPDESDSIQPGTNQVPQSQEIDQPALIMNTGSESVTTNPQWDFRPTETDRVSDGGTTQTSTDVSVPVSMDISEPSLIHEQNTEGEAVQSEPMEHSYVQSQLQSDEAKTNPAPQPDFSFIQPEELLDNSALKSRVHLNRKRVHQSQERRGEGERRKTGKEDKKGQNQTKAVTSQAEEEGMKEDDKLFISLHPRSYPHPSLSSCSSSSSSPSPAPAYRGVLKHSVSRDSESSMSMETVTKKRRMEDTRRVRFSEDVVTIAPGVSILKDDVTDEEEDSGTEEEGSVAEEDSGMQEEQEVVSVPRHSLPAWILALKRRKTGRNSRH